MKHIRGTPSFPRRRFTRRATLLGAVQLSILGMLGFRLRYLQVEQAKKYFLLAEDNRINLQLVAPERGEVFDRDNEVLAVNVPNYRIVIVRENAEGVDRALDRLSHLIRIEPGELARARREIQNNPPFVPVTVTDRVSWKDIAKVAVNKPAMPGITPEFGRIRHYPQRGSFAHIIGYVGPVSDYDLSRIEDPAPVLGIKGFQVGKVGLEAKLEDRLRGQTGAKQVEVNAAGQVMRELDRMESVKGADIQLTVDAGLQRYVQARLEGRSASAVVMDCRSGDLMAIASSPTFDPNLFVRGISIPDYQNLTSNKYRPLANKPVQGIYPPGSTFKMVTALAALEAGVVEVDSRIHCPGYTEVSDRRFHCWKHGGHGTMKLHDALAQSCDVYFYEVGLRTGIDRISAMARKLGLGVRHDVPLSAVAKGLVPDSRWKQRTHEQRWLPGDTVNASIGQGYFLASPLQLAVMTARIATGRSVNPRLVKRINGQETESGIGSSIGISEDSLQLVRDAMYSVVNHRKGTAFSSRIIDRAHIMAGKTGTSQVRAITAKERATGVIRNEDLPWERRDHALFVDYAPAANPKLAVCVVVEHGGGGSRSAAPIARDITLQALYGKTPPLSTYPEGDRAKIREQQEKMRQWPPDSTGSDQA